MTDEQNQLKKPSFPQSTQDVLDKGILGPNEHILVQVNKYPYAAIDDKIVVNFGDNIKIQPYIVESADVRDFYIRVPQEAIPVGSYTVSYTVTDSDYNPPQTSPSTSIKIINSNETTSPNYPAPSIVGAVNGVLDMSELSNIVMNIPDYDGIQAGDRVQCTIGSVTEIHIIDTQASVQQKIFPKSKINPGTYQVSYTVHNQQSTSINVRFIERGTTQPSDDHEPFIVMGARNTRAIIYNETMSPVCLTSLDKDTLKPISVRWEYLPGPGIDANIRPLVWPNTDGFYDHSPWLPLKVTSNDKSVILNPINVFGNGGCYTAGGILSDGLNPYRSNFVTLLNNTAIVGWGAENGVSAMPTPNLSDVIKVTSNVSAYAALQSDGTVTIWGDLHSDSFNPPLLNIVDIGAGGRSFVFQDSGGVLHFRGALNSQHIFTAPSMGSPGNEKNLFVGTTSGITVYNFYTGQLASWFDGTLEPNSTTSPPPGDYRYLRLLMGIEDGFLAITKEGKVITWGNPNTTKIPLQVAEMDAFTGSANRYLTYVQQYPGLARGWGVGTGDGPEMDQVVDISATGYSMFFRDANLTIKMTTTSAFVDGLYIPDYVSSMTNIVQVATTAFACAALRSDGTVVTWGRPEYGGDSSDVSSQLTKVRAIYSTGAAFVALTVDKRVVTWGNSGGGGNSSAVQSQLNGQLTYYKP
ncbi:hypothetical protein [Xenorhabdus bovienii]|uniref:hypothetical protein n=1 Tax=Xenorhabdus bovienii TaxID=40576 RepID=UPI003DA28447